MKTIEQIFPELFRYAKDASGHEHKGAGAGGGQFTAGSGGGSAPLPNFNNPQPGDQFKVGKPGFNGVPVYTRRKDDWVDQQGNILLNSQIKAMSAGGTLVEPLAKQPAPQASAQPTTQSAPAPQVVSNANQPVQRGMGNLAREWGARSRMSDPIQQSDHFKQVLENNLGSVDPAKFKEFLTRAWKERALSMHVLNEVGQATPAWRNSGVEYNGKFYGFVQPIDAKKMQTIAEEVFGKQQMGRSERPLQYAKGDEFWIGDVRIL